MSCPRFLGLDLKCSRGMCHQVAEQPGRVHVEGQDKVICHTHRTAVSADHASKHRTCIQDLLGSTLQRRNFPLDHTFGLVCSLPPHSIPVPPLATLRRQGWPPRPQAGMKVEEKGQRQTVGGCRLFVFPLGKGASYSTYMQPAQQGEAGLPNLGGSCSHPKNVERKRTEQKSWAGFFLFQSGDWALRLAWNVGRGTTG